MKNNNNKNLGELFSASIPIVIFIIFLVMIFTTIMNHKDSVNFPFKATIPALMAFVASYILFMLILAKIVNFREPESKSNSNWKEIPIDFFGNIVISLLAFPAGGLGGIIWWLLAAPVIVNSIIEAFIFGGLLGLLLVLFLNS